MFGLVRLDWVGLRCVGSPSGGQNRLTYDSEGFGWFRKVSLEWVRFNLVCSGLVGLGWVCFRQVGWSLVVFAEVSRTTGMRVDARILTDLPRTRIIVGLHRTRLTPGTKGE